MNKSEYSFSAFIGIDVAKNKIDIFEQKSQTVKTVGNNKQEINHWIKTLTETEQTIVIELPHDARSSQVAGVAVSGLDILARQQSRTATGPVSFEASAM